MACAVKIMKLINEKNILAFEWSHRLTKPGLRAPLIFHEFASDGFSKQFYHKDHASEGCSPLGIMGTWGNICVSANRPSSSPAGPRVQLEIERGGESEAVSTVLLISWP